MKNLRALLVVLTVPFLLIPVINSAQDPCAGFSFVQTPQSPIKFEDFNLYGSASMDLYQSEIDGDGKKDLVTVFGSQICVFLNITNGVGPAFTKFSSPILVGAATYSLDFAFGDLNGDGKDELVAQNLYNNHFDVYNNISTLGNPQFSLAVTIPESFNCALDYYFDNLKIYDVNHDGFADLAYMNNNTLYTRLNTTATIGASPTFGAIFTFNLPYSSLYIVSGSYEFKDLNYDGFPELVAYMNNDSLYIYRNESSGFNLQFVKAFKYHVPVWAIHYNPVHFADMDGDNKEDFAVLSASEIHFFRNISDPQINFVEDFTSTFGIIYQAGPGGISSYSFKPLQCHCLPDLLIEEDGVQGPLTMHFFANTSIVGAISFVATSCLDVTGVTDNFVLEDFDLDGKVDIASVCDVCFSADGVAAIGVFYNQSANKGLQNIGIVNVECTNNNDAIINCTTDYFTYHWDPPVSTTNTATDLPPGNYSVEVIAGTDCDTVINFTIDDVNGLLGINAGNDTTIYFGDSAFLNATTNAIVNSSYDFSWYEGSNFFCSNCQSIIVSPEGTTTYIVVGVNDNGCEFRDTITVYVISPPIHLPDAFSPNGDGVDDVFRPLPLKLNPIEFSFQIFNRWGEEVFSTSKYQDGWNGTYKNVLQPLDVYVYILRGVGFDGHVSRLQGNVTLVR